MSEAIATLDARAAWWRRAPTGGTPADETPFAFKALIAFLVLLVLSPQSFVPALGALRLAMLTAVAGIGSFLFERFTRGEPLSIKRRELTVVACLVTWAVVTFPLSYWPGGSLQFLTDTYFKTVAIFWLMANVLDRPSRLRAMAWTISLLAFPLGFTAVKHYASHTYDPDLLAEGVRRISGYNSSLAENPNDLALMLNLMLPVAVAMLTLARRLVVRAVLLATVVFSAAGIVFTFSRAGFLTLAASVLLFLSRQFRRGRPGWVVGAVVFAIGAVTMLPAGYANRLSTIQNIDADPTHSAQDRWADTKAAMQYLIAHPVIGCGIGQNILALNEARGNEWKEVHNVYLEYGVELGVGGLVLFLLLLFWSIGRAREAQRVASAAGRVDVARIAEAIEIALLGFSIASFFHPVAYHFYFYLFASLAIGAETSARVAARDAAPRRTETGPWWKRAVPATAEAARP